MVIVKATRESEAEISPGDEKILKEMGAFNEELVKAGVMLAGEGLKPSKQGKRVRFAGATRTVIDGPFTETKELVAGYWLWQVRSMEEAVAWVKRCPSRCRAARSAKSRSVLSTRRRTSRRPIRPASSAGRRMSSARRSTRSGAEGDSAQAPLAAARMSSRRAGSGTTSAMHGACTAGSGIASSQRLQQRAKDIRHDRQSDDTGRV
jgi:hypothetical protein